MKHICDGCNNWVYEKASNWQGCKLDLEPKKDPDEEDDEICEGYKGDEFEE